MAIFLRHSWNVRPPRWGSPADVQYAIKVNAEKIYDVDPDSNALIIPGFWGLPPLDYSGKNNHGTNHGATYKDGTLDFDGVNDYVNCGNNESLNITSAITISVWVKQAVGNNGYILMKNTADDSKRLYSLYSYGDINAIRYHYYDGVKRSVEWSYALDDKALHNVSLTVNGTTAILYVDSISQGNRTLNSAFQGDAAASVIIGTRHPATGYFFDGLIDEVRIANVDRTADQIALFHALPYGLYQPVSRPVYFFQAAAGAWTGKINGVTNPAKIMGVAVANISKVNGV